MSLGTLLSVSSGVLLRTVQSANYLGPPGGSTIVLLFEKGVLQWDEDLMVNGRSSLETLVRVRSGVATSTKTASLVA
jgi:hypothetical protein